MMTTLIAIPLLVLGGILCILLVGYYISLLNILLRPAKYGYIFRTKLQKIMAFIPGMLWLVAYMEYRDRVRDLASQRDSE